MSIENLRSRASGQNPQSDSTMKVRKVAPMSITLAEVKEVIDTNPTHPKAGLLRSFYEEHSRFLPQETVIAVEKAVILGILDGGNVVEKSSNDASDGREVIETEVEGA